jgi:hypothetical protein
MMAVPFIYPTALLGIFIASPRADFVLCLFPPATFMVARVRFLIATA